MSSYVLVVEDDPTLAGMLHLYLEKEGYRVTVAADGAAGLAAARAADQPDLMILDVMLPRLVELQGGSVEAHGTAGAGSAFTVTLPAA